MTEENTNITDKNKETAQEKTSETAKNKKISRLMFLLGIVVIAVGVIMLVMNQLNYKKSNDLYDKTKEEYTEVNENSGEWYEQIQVDFDALQKINGEIVGWIHFEKEDIDYPILRANDNDKYLRTTYDGTDATAGSIFMDYNNESDMTDSHILIYGHNMRNLSMFGNLKKYRTEENYFDEHKYFQIITPEGAKRYEVISYKEVSETDNMYTIYRTSDEKYMTYLNDTILSGSLVDNKEVNVEELQNPQVVSLSTCTASDDKRFVVSGVLVDEHK
ncbi:MAG: class B sortase [Lachnospiraceae bacterium]|nr:class B sortase [Lachnospiraceae bacterium]